MEEIIIAGVLGAAAGYITNDYAIKMLFDEIGIKPFKLGGVVVKKRKEFEENISQLVEDEIITHQNIKDVIRSKEFFQMFEKIIFEYIYRDLDRVVRGKKIGDIDSYDNLVINISEYIESDKNKVLSNFLFTILKDTKVKDFIDKDGIERFFRKIYPNFIQNLKNDRVLERYLKGFYSENCDKKLSELCDRKSFDILKEGLYIYEKKVKDVGVKLYLPSIKIVILEYLNTSGLKKEILNLKDDIADLRIDDILGEKSGLKLEKHLIKDIKGYINGENGEKEIIRLSKELIEYLKGIDKTLVEFMNKDTKEKLYNFIKIKFPIIIDEFIDYIRKNEEKIKEAVESSIDEVIGEKKGIKENLLVGIRNSLGDITEKFGIIGKIIEEIKKNKDNEIIIEKFTNIILQFLENNSIGDIVKKIELMDNSGIVLFIKRKISEILEEIEGKSIVSDRKFWEIIVDNFYEKVEEFIITTIENKIFELPIGEKIFRYIEKNSDKKLKDIVTFGVFENYIEEIGKSIYEKLDKVEWGEGENIATKFYNLNSEKNLSEWIPKDRVEDFLQGRVFNIASFIKERLEQIKDENMRQYFEQIKDKDKIERKITRIVIGSLIENLQYLMKGNIKNLVQKNIEGLSNDELKEMLREFMGRELKPINIMGGALGGIVGIGMGVMNFDLYSRYIDIVSYAGVGILTNCIAIWGIFRPYNKNMLMKIATLGAMDMGVIPKEKERFAKNMAKFVEKELLNKESLENLIRENRENLREVIIEKVSEDNFSSIKGKVLEKSEDILNFIMDKLFKFIDENKDKFLKILQKRIEKISFENLGVDRWIENIKEIENILRSDIKISRYIDKNRIDELLEEKVLDEYDEIIREKIQNGGLVRILEEKIDNISERLDSKISSVYSTEYIFEMVKSWILNYKKWANFLGEKIEKNIGKNLNSEKAIREIFDGKVYRYLEDNMEYISTFLMEKLKGLIWENRERIEEESLNNYHQYIDSSFLLKMGNMILGGDQIVIDVVNRSLEKIEKIFLEGKKDIEGLALKSIEIIGDEKISNLGLKLDRENVDTNLFKLFKNREIKTRVEYSLKNIIDYLCGEKIGEYLDIDMLKNLKMSITKKFGIGINNIEIKFRNSYKKGLLLPMLEVGKEIVLATNEEVSVLDIYGELNNKFELREKIYNGVTKRKSAVELYKNILDTAKIALKNEEIGDIVSFEKLIISIVERKDNITVEMSKNDKELIGYLLGILEIAPKESVEAVLNIFVTPFINVTGKNIKDLCSILKIDKLTYKELMNMDSRKIHKMFNSFAGPYFTRLKLYGGLGFVFAFKYLSCFLIGYYVFTQFRDRKKRELLRGDK